MSDLIGRQAAIRWVKTECNPYGKPTIDFESGKRVIEHLERMASAEPERKRGKWIKADSQQYFRKHYPAYTCSICNYKKGGNWNYCPNCGADMREEQ